MGTETITIVSAKQLFRHVNGRRWSPLTSIHYRYESVERACRPTNTPAHLEKEPVHWP